MVVDKWSRLSGSAEGKQGWERGRFELVVTELCVLVCSLQIYALRC